MSAKWYVRFHFEDAFFDPCLKEGSAASAACSAGFSPAGTKLRPLPPADQADRIDETLVFGSAVSIATIDLIGTEGLLVLENASAGARTLRVNLVLDR